MNENCHFVFGAASAFTATEAAVKYSWVCQRIMSSPYGGVQLTYDSKTVAAGMIGLTLLGSVFPDIDNPVSLFGKLTHPVSKWIGRIGKMTGHARANHRGIFHDPGMYILLAAACYYFGYLVPFSGFFIGIASHLFLDAMNPAGVRIFGVKFVRFAKIPSNSKTAVCLTWMFAGIVLAIGFGIMFYV